PARRHNRPDETRGDTPESWIPGRAGRANRTRRAGPPKPGLRVRRRGPSATDRVPWRWTVDGQHLPAHGAPPARYLAARRPRTAESALAAAWPRTDAHERGSNRVRLTMGAVPRRGRPHPLVWISRRTRSPPQLSDVVII